LQVALEHVDLSGVQAVLGIGFGGALPLLMLDVAGVARRIGEEGITTTTRLEFGRTANDLAVGIETQGA
jgi:hypothetical protein